MSGRLFIHFLIWILMFELHVTTSQEMYPGDDELEPLAGQILAEEGIIQSDYNDQYEPDTEMDLILSDISNGNIIEQDITDIHELPEETKSQFAVDEENAVAELDMAEKWLEMAEADDISYVHMYSIENGMLKEEELPSDKDQDEAIEVDELDEALNDDVGKYDLTEESNFEIEALLSAQPRWIDLVSPHHDILVEKKTLGKTAVVNILAIIDYSLYRIFLARHDHDKGKTMMEMRKYYIIMVAMANERFATIRVPGMAIKLVLSNIIVSKDRSDASWVENVVQYRNRRSVVSAVTALTKFQKWLKANKDLPAYDHAMAFTSYDMLIHRTSPVSGVAPLSGMCNTGLDISSSLIVDRADYRAAFVIAHELGHSLGASHDGSGKSRRCPVSHNYIMSPKAVYTNDTFQNIFTFSTCSLTQMRTFLRSPAAACLYDKARSLQNYDLKKTPPGKLFSADAQCKMVFGKKSGLCGEPSLQKTICERLWCTSPNDKRVCRTNDLLYALPGTTCGINKNCERRACVMSQSVLPPSPRAEMLSNKLTSAPPKQNSSPHKAGRHQAIQRPRYRSLKGLCRDRKVNECEAAIRANPARCRRQRVQKACCQACRRHFKS